jgi:hypothetical protein
MFNNYINEINNAIRIIIIGDIHGDIKRFKSILIDSKIINNNFEWIAEPPNTIIVQLGDQIDSLNRNSQEEWEILNDYEMIYFTEHLNNIARVKGGFCISLIGNHELMNIIGDFAYVSKNSICNKNENNYEECIIKRKELFRPKGSLALLLAKRPLIIKIKDLLFCHAKLELRHLELLKKYNKDIYYLNYIFKNYLENNRIDFEDKEILDKIIIGNDGILWNRNDNNKDETENLYKQLNIKYMFIGHTALDQIVLIDDQIWYCDTGISRAFGTTKYQYIDINKNTINVRTIQE